MNCQEAERLFDRYLDREISLTEYTGLERHLSACARCAGNWMATRKAVDLLAGLPEEAPDPQLYSRIVMSLPGRKLRTVTSHIWQAAAAVIVAGAIAGVSYYSGARQMTAAAVRIQDGRMVVRPKPGRPLVIPPGSTIVGDLRVEGDIYLYGQVKGNVSALGRALDQPAPPDDGFWKRLARKAATLLRGLFGR